MDISKKLINRASKITFNIDGTDYHIKSREGDADSIERLEAKYGVPRSMNNEVQDVLINDMKKKDDIF